MATAPWSRLLTKYPILGNLSKMMTGTMIAQLIALLTQPVVARLYTDSHLGLLATFMAIPTIVASVSSLRYDMAIVLPKENSEAGTLMRFSLLLSGAVSALLALVGLLGRDVIAEYVGEPSLAPWAWLMGPVAFLIASNTILAFWLNRHADFSGIALKNVVTTSTNAVSRIGLALAGFASFLALVASQVASFVLASTYMARRARRHPLPPRAESSTPLRTLLRRYRKMPLLNAPNILVDSLRTQGMILLLGITYQVSTVGQFQQAWVLMQAPVTLIGGAMNQVFYQKFATAKRGELAGLALRSVGFTLVVGLIPFTALWFLAPWLVPAFLGDQWHEAGLIAQAIIPWLYLVLTTSPISTVFVVTNSQQYMLLFSLVYMSAPLSMIWLNDGSIPLPELARWMALAQAVLLCFLIGLTLHVSRRHDRGAPATEETPEAVDP